MNQIRQIKQMDTNGYKLEKTPNSCSYSLYIKGDYKEELFLSLPRIPNMFYDDHENKIIFVAESVTKLLPCLTEKTTTYLQALSMIKCLSKQMNNLKRMSNLIFYGFDLDDILVINEDTFFIASTRCMTKIDPKNKCIYFYKPIEIPYFSNPELNELTKLPAKIDYRSSYYSLGALILFCSTNIYIFSELKEIDITLSPIYYTKLYWFLKRCFLKDYKQRILLFI